MKEYLLKLENSQRLVNLIKNKLRNYQLSIDIHFFLSIIKQIDYH